jgi:CheY-like chemotaxis protein
MPEETPLILYVEDDPHSRRILQMLLTKTMNLPDVTVFEDSSDFSARVEALQPKPQIIFLDIHMQPHDGFAMLAMLRNSDSYRNARIIALTASVMNEEVIKLQSAGFDGCIAKPIKLELFPSLMNAILCGEEVWRIV